MCRFPQSKHMAAGWLLMVATMIERMAADIAIEETPHRSSLKLQAGEFIIRTAQLLGVLVRHPFDAASPDTGRIWIVIGMASVVNKNTKFLVVKSFVTY